MPGPIPSASSRPSVSYDDVLAAGGSAHLDETVPVQGPRPAEDPGVIERIKRSGAQSLHEARENPREAAKKVAEGGEKVAEHGVKHAAVHKVIHAMKHAPIAAVATTGRLLNVGMYVAPVVKLVIGPSTLREDEKATVRQGYDLATARMASNVLPPSYLQATVERQVGVTTSVLDGMTRTLERRLGSPEKAETAMRQFQAEAERGATAGMKHAASHGLRSPAERDSLLARDRGFRERYNGDLTFRAGVDAMVWLGANQPAEFEQRRAALSGQTARVVGGR